MEAAVDLDPLAPYVPRLIVEWLTAEPEARYRNIVGTFVFADISGFTQLTERLAGRGREGAEEMGELLNAVFDKLLGAAYDYGGNLVKWGGDAVLLLFRGEDHARMAAQAAWSMQEVMRRLGRLQTSGGVVRLGMSIGVHSGDLDFFLVGTHHRELIVSGPAATETVRMEKAAKRGQVHVSPATGVLLPGACLEPTPSGGCLLVASPQGTVRPNAQAGRGTIDLGAALPAQLRKHLRAGNSEHEHRSITVGFLEFSGVDTLTAELGVEILTNAIARVIDEVQQASHLNGVTLLATDLSEDGGKIVLTAGAPRSSGEHETRVLSTLRRLVHSGGRLKLRAGVTCGNVFAGDYGPPYCKTYSITGDMVNLAARLMSAGAVGSDHRNTDGG